MKTSIIIFFFLLQAWFISASAMSETPSPPDSASKEKCLIVLTCKAEYSGKLLSQSDDTLKFLTNKGKYFAVPIKQVACIVKYLDDYNTDLIYDINSDNCFRIISEEGFDYKIKFTNDSIAKIDKYNILKFPFNKIKSVNFFSKENESLKKIFIFGASDSIIGQIISRNSNSLKIITQSNFLLDFPKEKIHRIIPIFSNPDDTSSYINPTLPLDFVNDSTNDIIQLKSISDSSALGTPEKRIVLKDENEITGNVISETKDSVIIKVDSGVAAVIMKSGIDGVYNYDYNTRNQLYIDVAYMGLAGYINFSYDRLIFDFLSIRIGYGYGYIYSENYTGINSGLNLMANFLLGSKSSKFEIGVGICYDNIRKTIIDTDGLIGGFTIGYRYQPKYGGFIFRIGFSVFRNIGGGYHFSFGYAF